MSDLIERLEAAAAADANRTRGEWTQGELPRLIHHRPNADYVSACTRLDFAALAARLRALEAACRALLAEHPCGTSHRACRNPTCAATIARSALAALAPQETKR